MAMDSQIAGQLVLSALLGGIIGLERAWMRKPAGMRTLMLVGLGSTLFVLVSSRMAGLFKGAPADPTRIAANVVVGLGFLGAGTIMHARGSVRGLTTAATVWVVGAVGLAVGCGYYAAAVLAT